MTTTDPIPEPRHDDDIDELGMALWALESRLGDPSWNTADGRSVIVPRDTLREVIDALRAALDRQDTPENYWTHDCCAGAVVTVHAPDCARQATPASGGLDVEALREAVWNANAAGPWGEAVDTTDRMADDIAREYARLTSEATS